MRQDASIDPTVVRKFGVNGQTCGQLEPGRARGSREPLDLRPWRLGVDMVNGHRRDAAPVVDSRVEQAREVVVGEVRRRLDIHLRPEHEPRGGGRPEQLLERRLRSVDHLRPRLGAEVLDDHLLDVPVALVEVANREQGVDPLGSCLTDADQDPACERDRELACEAERLEADDRSLVRRAEVRAAALGEPIGARLEHDPLRRRHPPERSQLIPRHHARVCVGKQTGLLEHEAAHAHEVLDRRLAAEPGELLPCRAVAELRLVAEREQRLAAAGGRARSRDLEHLVFRHVRALALPRRRGERAVVADVAAELRQRDEDLRRIRDETTLSLVAQALRRPEEILGR